MNCLEKNSNNQQRSYRVQFPYIISEQKTSKLV